MSMIPDESHSLQEAEWGSWVDRSELIQDMNNWGGGAFSYFGPLPSSITDRADGSFFPIFQTELELAQIRGDCRVASYFSSVALGAVEALQRYVFGKGFTLSAEANRDHGLNVDPVAIAALVAEVKQVIKEFDEENKITVSKGAGSLDCEMDRRIREDGSTLVKLESRLGPGGRPRSTSSIGVKATFIEPDQLTTPADAYRLEKWLGLLDRQATSFSFGVHTPRRDTDEILGYHIVYDGVGREWDYIPSRVGHAANPLKTMVYAKRNTPRNVKCGLPDFFPIASDIGREAKLSKRLSKAAILQASIAWIRERPSNQSAPGTGNIQALRGGTVNVQTPNGSQQIPVADYPDGAILDVPLGQSYKAGPMGAERNPNFLLIASYLMRRIGIRWNMPEYMISGDASNANFASTLVAGTPFVIAREADQQFHVGAILDMLWKVVQFYHMAGRFKQFGFDFLTLKRLIAIVVTPPDVATRDPLTVAQTLKVHQDMGWSSPRTNSNKLGYDYDSEVTNGAKPLDPTGAADTAPGTPGAPGTQPAGGEFSNTSTLQWRRNVKAIDSTLERFRSQQISRDQAHIYLTAAGLAADRADRLLDGQPDAEVDQAVAADEAGGQVKESTQSKSLGVTDLLGDPWKGYP